MSDLVSQTAITREPIDAEYATGIAPRCCWCGQKVAKSDVVWGSTAGAWHPRCEAARVGGVDGVTFHDSRHAAATAMAEKLTALELARVLGHRDLRATMGYYNEKASALAWKLG